MRQEKGLEDKENESPVKKRLKVVALKENEAPSMKRSKVGALMEEQGAGLAVKEGEVILESNMEAGDPVEQESTAREEIGQESTAAEEIEGMELKVLGEESVIGEGKDFIEDMYNPEVAMVQIEFVNGETRKTIETVANRDFQSREGVAHDEDKEEREEENSEEELERSLAAEINEATVEENYRLDKAAEQGMSEKAIVQGQDTTWETYEVAIEEKSREVTNWETYEENNSLDEATEHQGQVAAWKENLQQDQFVVGQNWVAVQDDAAKDCLDLVQFGKADDEVGEGEDEEDWQWEEVEEEEEDGVREAITEVVKLSSEQIKFDQEVEEVGCTFDNNGIGEVGPENLAEQPKHRLEHESTILENKRVRCRFVQDAIVEDSMWDFLEPKEENLREDTREKLREEELREEELSDLRSKDELFGEELKNVVTISAQDCTVLNLDVVVDAPEMFNIPDNFKEQVTDEFSPPPSGSKATKRKGRPAKLTRRKRSKH